MTVWSTRSGRKCSMRSSARLGRLSVGACAMPREGSSPAALGRSRDGRRLRPLMVMSEDTHAASTSK